MINEKFIALDSNLYNYVASHRSRNEIDTILDELAQETSALGDISVMQISVEQGAFFSLLVAASGARNTIEIGTFTGYSSLCIARGLPADGKLLCLDQSEEWTNVACKYWQRAGLDSKIELRIGDAKSTLAALPENEQFDFAFVDADKTGYDAYFELLLPRLKPNALVVFDNMLSGGRVAEENADDESRNENVRALNALNKKLAGDARVESVLLPVADGLNICRKK